MRLRKILPDCFIYFFKLYCQVAYTADAEGFHVDASNLPVANVVWTKNLCKQIFCAVELIISTSPPSSSRAQVQDTPTVAAAKAQHSALYGQIALSHAQVHSSLLTKLKGRFHRFTFFLQGIQSPSAVPAVIPQVIQIMDTWCWQRCLGTNYRFFAIALPFFRTWTLHCTQ